MAKVTITFGAPSLGKDGVELVEKAFGSSEYPLTATIKNLMPSPKGFSHGNGFCIGHVADITHCSANVSFEGLEEIKSFAKEVGQISDLNQYKDAISITAEGTEVEESSVATVGEAVVGQAEVASTLKDVNPKAETSSAVNTTSAKKSSRKSSAA